MFLLPLLVIALAGYAAYRALHRQVQPATAAAVTVPLDRASFWPTTVEGKIGVGAFVLNFVPIALVNVIQVAFLGWAVLIAALTFSGVARFVKHDRSTSVLIVVVLTAIGALSSLLFLAGEVFVGHE